jgi:mycothiol synthase
VSSHWQRVTSLTSTERVAVLGLINHTEVVLEREAIDDSRRRSVVHGWSGEHWLLHDDVSVVGYANVTHGAIPSVEMVGGGIDESLLRALLEVHGEIDWWQRDTHSRPANAIRTLQLMSRPLLDLPPAHGFQGAIRAFEPGVDDDDWLTQNNAAFADHPEQGTWRKADLQLRLVEPWFDPSGFLLLHIDGQLAASCWTRVHELYRERFGEIYVLTVGPEFQGQGLGKTMLSAGLLALRRKGVLRAELFVDADNTSAVALYQAMGFIVQREDQLLRYVAP